jgi:hypothetical protein
MLIYTVFFKKTIEGTDRNILKLPFGMEAQEKGSHIPNTDQGLERIHNYRFYFCCI